MDKHWNHYCTMSIVHFMAYPDAITGEGPIAESGEQDRRGPVLRRGRDHADQGPGRARGRRGT